MIEQLVTLLELRGGVLDYDRSAPGRAGWLPLTVASVLTLFLGMDAAGHRAWAASQLERLARAGYNLAEATSSAEAERMLQYLAAGAMMDARDAEAFEDAPGAAIKALDAVSAASLGARRQQQPLPIAASAWYGYMAPMRMTTTTFPAKERFRREELVSAQLLEVAAEVRMGAEGMHVCIRPDLV